MPTIVFARHSIATGEPGDAGLSPEGASTWLNGQSRDFASSSSAAS